MGLPFLSPRFSRPNRVSAYIWNLGGGEGAGAYFEDALIAGEWIHVVACYGPADLTDPTAGVQLYKNGVYRLGPPCPGTLYSNPLFDIAPQHGSSRVRIGTRDLESFLRGAIIGRVAIYPHDPDRSRGVGGQLQYRSIVTPCPTRLLSRLGSINRMDSRTDTSALAGVEVDAAPEDGQQEGRFGSGGFGDVGGCGEDDVDVRDAVGGELAGPTLMNVQEASQQRPEYHTSFAGHAQLARGISAK